MGQNFYVSEDFWQRDFAAASERAALAAGKRSHLYINGYPDGRVAYLGLNRQFNSFLNAIWSQPGWKFRRRRRSRRSASCWNCYSMP